MRQDDSELDDTRDETAANQPTNQPKKRQPNNHPHAITFASIYLQRSATYIHPYLYAYIVIADIVANDSAALTVPLRAACVSATLHDEPFPHNMLCLFVYGCAIGCGNNAVDCCAGSCWHNVYCCCYCCTSTRHQRSVLKQFPPSFVVSFALLLSLPLTHSATAQTCIPSKAGNKTIVTHIYTHTHS